MRGIYRRFGPHFVAVERFPMIALTTEQRSLLEFDLQNELPVSKQAPPQQQLNNEASIHNEHSPGVTVQHEGRRKAGGAPKKSEQNKPTTVDGSSGGKGPGIDAPSAGLSKSWKNRYRDRGRGKAARK